MKKTNLQSKRSTTMRPKKDIRTLAGDATPVPKSLVIRGGKPRASYTVTEVINGTPILNGLATLYGSLGFTASLLPNASSWSAVFDRYRIRSVDVSFYPTNVQINEGGTLTNAPLFHTAIDFDDDATPTSVAQLQRYSTYAGTIATSGIRRHFVPRSARLQYLSGVSSGYAEEDIETWRDCAYMNIPHYGIKYALEPCGTANVYRYDISIKLVVEFAGQRG